MPWNADVYETHSNNNKQKITTKIRMDLSIKTKRNNKLILY